MQMKQEKILEALLFAVGESVPIARLAEAIGCDIPLTRNLLIRMGEAYERNASGILLMETEDSYQLCTNPEYYDYVQRLVQLPMRKPLTQTVLETLSIIAYKQPVTKAVIEEIRGVNVDYAVNKLLAYGLVIEKGRLDAPGKPILLATSDEFLRFYGLKSVKELFNDHMGLGLGLTVPPSYSD
jgi:segregation and condensation protein B